MIAVNIDVDDMTESKGPERLVDDLRPSGLGMKKHGEGPSRDKTYASFDNAIHVVGTSTSYHVALTLGGKVICEVLIGEDSIVRATF